MKIELLDRLRELQKQLESFQEGLLRKENVPTDLCQGIGTDIVIAQKSFEMVPSLLTKNTKDAVYYFSRACYLMGCAQGKLAGYTYAVSKKS